jgi:hypothetical protein
MVRYHHRITAAIALTLALAAAAPASARPTLDPSLGAAIPGTPASTNLCSEVCSGSGYSAARTGAALPHDPRPRAVALAGTGSAHPSSPAESSGSNGPRSEVVSGGGYGNPNAPATVVRVLTPSDGFHWDDAGIGAGGALALMTLLIGVALGATNIRRRAARSTA